MKFTITRQFSFNNEKYEIISDSKSICTVKATPSNEYEGQFNFKLSNPFSKHIGEDYCLVEPDENQTQNYLIYLKNDQKNTKNLFGQLLYQTCSYNNYLYTIIIGQKLYKVRSADLKDRRLSIVDAMQVNSSSNGQPYPALDYPELLYQVTDSFTKSNKKYHVNIHNKEWALGYLAITILLDLHECK
ncbi:unnamed protein product [Adineta steineri]|uniref:Uncharacterized protein n=1 Tax=Adineta steineri TaxID=433720 RepID=A0A814BKQ7_9BILA|nr:unnamed protein product [Adineta steineri]CAF4072654.1 unnamed protein product [Adineta steineri]